MMKGRWVLVFALIFLMAGVAYAQQQGEVRVSTTSPGVPAGACWEQSAYTLEFGEHTVVTAGDVMEFYVDAPLCKDIDLYIMPDCGGSQCFCCWNGTNMADLDAGLMGPFGWKGTPPQGKAYWADNGTEITGETGSGIYFHIYGDANTHKFYVEVLDCDDNGTKMSALYVPDNSTMVLTFFDQMTNDDFDVDGVWVWEDDGDGNCTSDEIDAATSDENSICIQPDAGLPEGTSIRTHISVENYWGDEPYRFKPSDPETAHVEGAVGFDFYSCKGKEECGPVAIAGPQAGSCTFDFEGKEGYCVKEQEKDCDGEWLDFKGGRKIIYTSADDFGNSPYTLELRIEGPAVWADNHVDLYGYGAGADPCKGDGVSIGTFHADVYQADGVTSGGLADGDCELTEQENAKVLKISGINLSGYKYLRIDLPRMAYDRDSVNPGDKVQVRFTLKRSPCGLVFDGINCVAEFVDSCCIAGEYCCYLRFPYFTAITEDEWWDGIALINRSDSPITCKLYFYEADGDEGNLEVAIPARGMWVELLSDILDEINASGNATLGDSRRWAEAYCEGKGTCDGFAMFGELTYGQAQGYLPRCRGDLPIDYCKF